MFAAFFIRLYNTIFNSIQMPKKRIIQKRAALVPLEFCLYEIVFAKQKGYPAWPAVITEFHPQKQRCAKVEFFAWDKQW